MLKKYAGAVSHREKLLAKGNVSEENVKEISRQIANFKGLTK